MAQALHGGSLVLHETTGDSKSRDLLDIREKILGFLLNNPRGQDTLEGIAVWWLLDQDIRTETERVLAVLKQLVEEGLAIEKVGPDNRLRYAVNPHQIGRIRQLVGTRR